MIYSKVFLKVHWGFSVVKPSAAKAKPAFYLPPPTTLIGALSYGKFRGIDTDTLGKGYGSPAYNLVNVKAAARLDSEGAYIEDIVRNVILYFLRKENRSNPKYFHGIISTGKIYMPSGKLVVVYVTDSVSKEELERLSWSITRIGCKECLVSVEDVEIGEAKKISGRVNTKYYFKDTVKIVRNKDFAEFVTFWDEKGFLWGKEGEPVRYVLPITTYPLASKEVEVEAKEAYEVGGEYVVFD
ncbi:type I-A CRISPR-associated protein Cas5 [Acidianus sulfidivorans JP7]|uniref:Type I-A CRISPR-associated protein Cas5 n=1 Tax=Acidianus sulfidivorans JP7 TaxID=619593 RepID=A0A2U9IQ49_9CREN|nr:type I-A CRISPR-associated protein Cas5a [Acidianus sulfidivorans]AWR98107.1 type I-A CRISPR-associated protein Cas5 [Acidianus sulfidivorans JP7]